MSRRRDRGRPRREGLPAWATALVVLGLGGLAAVAGLLVGGGRGVPTPPVAGPADGPRAEAGVRLPAGEPDATAADAADDGAAVFAARCAPCHTVAGGPAGADAAGGDLAEAALRRDPRWVRAMVARPDSMFRADTAARRILEVHGLEPSEVDPDDPELRALLAYLRAFDPAR